MGNAKDTVYLSLIFTATFVGFFLPLGFFIGAPFGLILLALFRPYFGEGRTIGIALLLLPVRVIANFNVVVLIALAFKFDLIIFPDIVCYILSFLCFALGHFLFLRTAEKILQKSKIWTRIQL